MSGIPESGGLSPWVEAAQASVEAWVGRQQQDFAGIEASVDDAVAQDLIAWIGGGPSPSVPAPDVADLQRRLTMRAAALEWPVVDDEVAEAVGDVRAVVERDVASRCSQAGGSASPRSARRVGAERVEKTGAGSWLLAAAAVLAASLIAVFWGKAGRLERADRVDVFEQAAQVAVESGDTGNVASGAVRGDGPRVARSRSGMAPAEVVPTEVVPTEVVPTEVVPTDVPDLQIADARARPSVQALAEQAELLWRAGDKAGAQRALMRIVRRGGRTPRVELAYADLFTLARQRGETRKRRQLYQGYLRRFPKGKLADDARAGLCRTSTTGTRDACWSDYLQRHPTGSYRAEAKAAH